MGSFVIIGIMLLYYNRKSTQKIVQVHTKGSVSDDPLQIPSYLTNPQNDESIKSRIMSFSSKSKYSLDLTPDPNSPMKYCPSPLRYNSSPFKYNSSPFKNKPSSSQKQNTSPYTFDCSPMANKSSNKVESSTPDFRCDEESPSMESML